MTDLRDLTGVWYGRYVSQSGAQDNRFVAVLTEHAGLFTGTITEPDEAGGAIRRASVVGRRQRGAIDFVKQYEGDWTHSVQYLGTIDADGLQAAGRWRVEWETGQFRMQRERFDAAELEAEEAVREPVTRRVD